jgi:peptidoglycan/LPS O-acetylase OafA/YrhL
MKQPPTPDGGPQRRAAAVELPALTSLRGLAALAVVGYHASFLAHNLAGGGPPLLWRRGYLAVDLFFFLSGFILTHVYAGRLVRERGWRSIGSFLWARFCRIYPACLFVTALYALSYAVGNLAFRTSFETQLVASLLLMQVPWLDSIEINPPAWSISAEVYAYLAFPLLMPALLGLNRSAAVALGAAVLIASAANHGLFNAEEQTWGWGALIRALPEFVAGILLYRAFSEGFWARFWQRDATLAGIAAAMAAALFLGLPDGAVVLLMPALLLAAVGNEGRLSGVLNAAPLRWLGDVSYSVYIFQAVPFMLLASLSGPLAAHGLGGVWFESIAVVAAVAGGVLVHRTVDLPLRTFLRPLPDRIGRLAARRRAARAVRIRGAAETN